MLSESRLLLSSTISLDKPFDVGTAGAVRVGMWQLLCPLDVILLSNMLGFNGISLKLSNKFFPIKPRDFSDFTSVDGKSFVPFVETCDKLRQKERKLEVLLKSLGLFRYTYFLLFDIRRIRYEQQ